MCVRGILYMKWVTFGTGKFTLLHLADICQNWFSLKSFSTDSLKLLKNMHNIYQNWSAAQRNVALVGLSCCWWSCMAGIHSASENYFPLWVQGHGSWWMYKEYAEKIKKLKLDRTTTQCYRFMAFKVSIKCDSWHSVTWIVSKRSCTLALWGCGQHTPLLRDWIPGVWPLKPRPSFGLQHSGIVCRIQGIPSDSGIWKEGERCDSWWFLWLEMSSSDHVPCLPC